MSDVIFIAVMIAFFVLCALYVSLCDRMIGSDEVAMATGGAPDSSPDDEPALSAASTATNLGVTP
jgi:hypothetical protein